MLTYITRFLLCMYLGWFSSVYICVSVYMCSTLPIQMIFCMFCCMTVTGIHCRCFIFPWLLTWVIKLLHLWVHEGHKTIFRGPIDSESTWLSNQESSQASQLFLLMFFILQTIFGVSFAVQEAKVLLMVLTVSGGVLFVFTLSWPTDTMEQSSTQRWTYRL